MARVDRAIIFNSLNNLKIIFLPPGQLVVTVFQAALPWQAARCCNHSRGSLNFEGHQLRLFLGGRRAWPIALGGVERQCKIM